jgi:hypothetical protein
VTAALARGARAVEGLVPPDVEARREAAARSAAEIDHRFVAEIRDYTARTGHDGYVTVGARSLYEGAVAAGLLMITRTEMGCHRLRAQVSS